MALQAADDCLQASGAAHARAAVLEEFLPTVLRHLVPAGGTGRATSAALQTGAVSVVALARGAQGGSGRRRTATARAALQCATLPRAQRRAVPRRATPRRAAPPRAAQRHATPRRSAHPRPCLRRAGGAAADVAGGRC
jgi:hypothetical protein